MGRKEFVKGVLSRVGGHYCSPPRSGCTDCSGLVCEEYEKATGKSISCGSVAQFVLGKPVKDGKLRAGDLLFYDTDGGTVDASHVGIYVGDGQAVHAMNPRDGIKKTPVETPYWSDRFLGARRLKFSK